MKIAVSFFLMLFSVSASSQSLDGTHPIKFKGHKIVYGGKTIRLDEHHLYLNSQLQDVKDCPFAFNTIQDAFASMRDEATVYVAPGVYWVDDPDHPSVVSGRDGREPFGMVVKAKSLHLVGLNPDARHVALASQRGQMQGAIGNFTMFDFWCDSLVVENMTMGNYCNVDLDFPLSPSLSRKKRSGAITQAHVGYVHGRYLRAKNVRFISRLNLNPLNGADQSVYDDCHFECTDDAMNGTAIYRHCEVDLYGQKPFWSTFGKGAMFIDCDFNVKGENREMYFCKQGAPLALIDCRYHAPVDSIYIGWTAYPQPWLRCYQQNFTLNGKPYTIGQRHPANTVVLSGFSGDVIPYKDINLHEASLLTGKDTLLLYSSGSHWRVQPGYEQYASVMELQGDTVCVIPTNNTDEIAHFCLESFSDDNFVAACELTVRPSVLPPPAFLERPRIDGYTLLSLAYTLNLDGHRDESRITWCRDGIPVSVSHNESVRQYRLTAADDHHAITARIEPKSNRSGYGRAVVASHVPNVNFSPINLLETDFSDFPCDWQKELLPGYWVVDGYKPADTEEFPWTFDTSKPMWEYGEGFNGARGKGLLQAQRGARLMYMPLEGEYGDMSLTLKVDPTKSAGQGFGSATGQYMDVCLKFDPVTLTGYGLRIIRTTKYSNAVDFYLVAYQGGKVSAISETVSSSCYRTGCTIVLKVSGNKLSAHVETETPQPAGSTLPHQVNLSADVRPNHFGGIAIQHTGSCGESTTMLHALKATWD